MYFVVPLRKWPCLPESIFQIGGHVEVQKQLDLKFNKSKNIAVLSDQKLVLYNEVKAIQVWLDY